MLAYATVSSLILSGCGGCGSKKEEQDAPVKLAAEQIVEPYEQIFSIPFEGFDKKEDVIQLPSHPGYEVCGFGPYISHYKWLFWDDTATHGDVIYYTNTDEVEVTSYEEFGTLTDPQKEENLEKNVLDSNQHVLLVKAETTEEYQTYSNHPGYKLLFSLYRYDSTYMCYTNIEPVSFSDYEIVQGELKSTEFGTPVEKEKEKTLVKE